MEQPTLHCKVIDIDPASPSSISMLPQELWSGIHDGYVGYRGDVRYLLHVLLSN